MTQFQAEPSVQLHPLTAPWYTHPIHLHEAFSPRLRSEND